MMPAGDFQRRKRKWSPRNGVRAFHLSRDAEVKAMGTASGSSAGVRL